MQPPPVGLFGRIDTVPDRPRRRLGPCRQEIRHAGKTEAERQPGDPRHGVILAATGRGWLQRHHLAAAAAGEPYGDGSYFWVGNAGTWFWIDPVNDLTFVGMIQHSGSSIQEVQGMSRNLVYQAVVGD
jgi:CubicO group peptidase (beta-lactamase class C family)